LLAIKGFLENRMDEDTINGKNDIDKESIRLALDKAWRDHHHTRDQTWRTLQAEIVLVAWLVAIDFIIGSLIASIIVGVLVILAAIFGMQITIRHRNKVEVIKFQLISKFEHYLKIDRVIGKDFKLPEEISFWDAFKPKKSNTSIFILRVHIIIFLFTITYIAFRCLVSFKIL
jgi:hypothetical protein